MVRIFTPDPERALQGDALREVEEAFGKRRSACSSVPGGFGGQGGSGGEDHLPSVSEMGVMVGEEDGHLSAFTDATGGAQVLHYTRRTKNSNSIH